MTTSTPVLALSTGLRAHRSVWRRLRTRTHRTSTARPAGKDFSLLPVCGQFPATAPVRVSERHR